MNKRCFSIAGEDWVWDMGPAGAEVEDTVVVQAGDTVVVCAGIEEPAGFARWAEACPDGPSIATVGSDGSSDSAVIRVRPGKLGSGVFEPGNKLFIQSVYLVRHVLGEIPGLAQIIL